MADIRDISYILQQTFNEVPGISYQDKLDYLFNCNCCIRHQVNKPFIFSPWHETPDNNQRYIHACACNCRHVARFICRQAYNTPPVTRANSPNNVIEF